VEFALKMQIEENDFPFNSFFISFQPWSPLVPDISASNIEENILFGLTRLVAIGAPKQRDGLS
jgi:hypothetical protein